MNMFSALNEISQANPFQEAMDIAVRCISEAIGHYGLPCLVHSYVGIIPNVTRFSSCFSQYLPSCQITLRGKMSLS
jgi:hypothetical protein